MKSSLNKIALNAILILFAIAVLYPLLWMVLLSFKSNPEKYSSFSDLLFSQFTLQNFQETINSDKFYLYIFNSAIIATIVTLGNVLFCFMTAYALVRREFIGRKFTITMIMGLLLVPAFVTMIPVFSLMVDFGWIDTYWSLILPWLVSPFGVYLVYQYMKGIPFEIEDAAKIDGASDFKIVFQIIMPLCKPILTVLAIYTFLSNWNSFLYPYLLTNSENLRTLPVGLAFYFGKQSIDWGNLMAGATISALPIIIMFIFFQNSIIKGLTAGALKE